MHTGQHIIMGFVQFHYLPTTHIIVSIMIGIIRNVMAIHPFYQLTQSMVKQFGVQMLNKKQQIG